MAGLALVVAAAAAFARYRPARVAIEGVSMAPTLLPDDWVLVVTPDHFDRDDVVVVEHPQRPGYEIVKRLIGGARATRSTVAMLGADEYWVEGDFARALDRLPRLRRRDGRAAEGEGGPDLLAARARRVVR